MDLFTLILGKNISSGSGSGGVEYSSIVYNEDNTVTLTEKDGTIHTMVCTYENGKLIGVTYDGNEIDLRYAEDLLLSVSSTSIDVSNAPTSGSGGATLNIAYGETAPEDISKLWIKANEPANISIGSDFKGVESITASNFLPKAYGSMGCARVGTKIYLFGGAGSSYLDTINMFDTETKEIATLTTKLPSARNYMGCAAVGNKIYLFGGYDGSSCLKTINIFDTETKEITALATELPFVYSDMCCAAVGNKVYLFGGYSGARLKTINMFDTETNVFTTLTTTLPWECNFMSCAAVGNNVYLFGGFRGGYSINNISVFDTETNEITTLTTTLPKASSQMGCARVGTKIYLFGGSTYSLDTINMFDTETKEITTLATKLSSVRNQMGCAAVGNKVYLFGGYNGSSYLNTIEEFTLTHELANGDIEIQSGLINNKVQLINSNKTQLEIGIENVYIGNENNEAELCEAYLHNGTDWQQI